MFPDPTSGEMEFLRAELLTGLTLAKIARRTDHEDKKNRNRVNARKAYDSVLRFLPKTEHAMTDEWKEINEKLTQLKFELQSLGEEI